MRKNIQNITLENSKKENPNSKNLGLDWSNCELPKKYFYNLERNKIYKFICIFIISQMMLSCQFFFPTSTIDNEPYYFELNNNFYLSEGFEKFDLLKKKDESEIFEVLLFSIDSIIKKGNEIYISKGKNYYILKDNKFSKCERIKLKFKSINEFIKIQQ